MLRENYNWEELRLQNPHHLQQAPGALPQAITFRAFGAFAGSTLLDSLVPFS